MVAKRRTPLAEYERAVAVYTAAGGQETVQRVVTAISRLSRRLDIFYRDQFVELALAPGEWSVLQAVALEGRNGGSTPTRLADLGGVSPSTMTHRLDRMVARGLVQRTPDPENRTRIKVALTDAGWELFRTAVLDADTVEADILSSLDDRERRQLASLLEKLVAGLPHSH
ncbi:MAG TPA: MarR family winged helix-turn-helix transcriptional regulator [Jatrophihabitantaceae bacterium]|jgi:DNA-binding MarR family transcriptional regulator|nr:MarR family winged helix-turn-helix transcriptional regulator [Jatrophihabitantaceae bacterium]